MAPSPEYDKEPKAPDKNITGAPNEELKNPLGVVSEPINSDQKATTGLTDGEIPERKYVEAPEDNPWRSALDDAVPYGKYTKDRDKASNLFKENKHVETLDDGQLRALLDEAITYKCPKDREGKSSLFKELLEEVEQDEQACEAAGAGGRAWPGGRARNPRALNACGSNSLQDLVAALAAEAAPRRRHAPVSARTHHGGSLPSGVDRSFLLSEEPMRGAGGGAVAAGSAGGGLGGGAEYVATVRCVNPEPLAERRVSASDTTYNATEMEILNRRSKVPMFPAMYTARTTLEIGGGSVCSGRAVTTTTASNQVDAGVPFNCITTPEVVAGCTTTASTAAVDPKPRSVIASSFNGLPLARGGYGTNTVAPPDDYKKSVDENGNAVQNLTPLCSTLYGSNQHKKPRRKKSSKNETIIDLNLVDGYRGDKDVTELLRFIEPDAEHGRGQKLGRLAKHRDDDKKRSTERRTKDKENKVKRASSLEELSRTKLEDLTDKPHAPAPAPARHKKDSGTAHPQQKSERRSWGDDARDSYFYADGDELHTTPTTTDMVSSSSAPIATTTTTVTVVSSHTSVTPPTIKEKKKGKSGSKSADSTPVSAATIVSSQEPQSDTTVELMDFQTVTKKRKQRKRYEDSDRDASGSDLCYRKPKPASPERRRKSAPPSDKSNDSNDDMDSVHSLPADTAAERSSAAAASSGTPHASYADIARTRHNIPDLIESCNYYIDVDAAPGSVPCPDADDKSRRQDLPSSAPPLLPVPVPVAALPEVPRRIDDTHAYDPESYPALDFRMQRVKPKESKASPPNKKPDKKLRALPDQSVDEHDINTHHVPPASKPTQFDDTVENCTETGIGSGVEGGDEPGVEGADGSPPDVVSDRRPPVILLDEAARPREMDGITFGFDINEQLLNGEGEGCDLVPGVPVRSGLRYLPPRQHHHTQYHHQIVNYVGTAWEDIIRCGNGKVRYFTE